MTDVRRLGAGGGGAGLAEEFADFGDKEHFVQCRVVGQGGGESGGALGRRYRQIDEHDTASLKLADSAAAAVEPFLADLITQLAGQLDERAEHLQSVHRTFSRVTGLNPGVVVKDYRIGDYGGLG